MDKRTYLFVKDVQRRLANNEPTTFRERNLVTMMLKADKRRKEKNAEMQKNNVQIVESKRF